MSHSGPHVAAVARALPSLRRRRREPFRHGAGPVSANGHLDRLISLDDIAVVALCMLALAAGDARGHGWRLGEREKAEVPGVPERVQAESKSSKAEERGRKNQKFNEGTVRRHRAKRFPVLYLHLSLLISFASFTRTGTGSGVI